MVEGAEEKEKNGLGDYSRGVREVRESGESEKSERRGVGESGSQRDRESERRGVRKSERQRVGKTERVTYRLNGLTD